MTLHLLFTRGALARRRRANSGAVPDGVLARRHAGGPGDDTGFETEPWAGRLAPGAMMHPGRETPTRPRSLDPRPPPPPRQLRPPGAHPPPPPPAAPPAPSIVGFGRLALRPASSCLARKAGGQAVSLAPPAAAC